MTTSPRPQPDTTAVPELRLKRAEDRRINSGHPWVFSNEVDIARTPLTALAPGAQVRLLGDRGQFLGYAYVNPHSLICARLMSRDPQRPIDAALIGGRLRAALTLRQGLSAEPFGRLVFGESDQLPGLVLDRFDDIIVGQIATAGMEALRPQVETAVREVLRPRVLYWKNDSGARELEQLPAFSGAAFGAAPAQLRVREAGIEFVAPLQEGQKTGWFYDQAANRALLARFLPAGARVLDVCSYVGAWAVTALKHGAGQATCVDASAAALEFAKANASAAGHALEVRRGDAFDVLRGLHEGGERFDAVILDPPAFIKRRKDIAQGQAAYRKLNQLALNLIDPAGLLVSCSCSYHLEEQQLLSAVQAAARHAGRFVQVLAFGGQSPDHPVHPAIPETRYLKALFCRVTRE
ncbi:MAG TPA: class I SAM-dependent rRNA methyltransferase [Steroidobacteraceae bacterium]|nr:class I SAM-dependent rRNA methyltransferase [Steroidobacteraceae bacterium]